MKQVNAVEKLKNNSPYKGNGGARKGAGRPKGKVNEMTLRIQEAQRGLRETIMANLEPILQAQLALAKGVSFVYRIERTKREGQVDKVEHLLVEDPQEIKEFLDENGGGNGTLGEKYYYITTKQPDNRSLDSLLDRLFGRSRQNLGLDGGEEGTPIRMILDAIEQEKK